MSRFKKNTFVEGILSEKIISIFFNQHPTHIQTGMKTINCVTEINFTITIIMLFCLFDSTQNALLTISFFLCAFATPQEFWLPLHYRPLIISILDPFLRVCFFLVSLDYFFPICYFQCLWKFSHSVRSTFLGSVSESFFRWFVLNQRLYFICFLSSRPSLIL